MSLEQKPIPPIVNQTPEMIQSNMAAQAALSSEDSGVKETPAQSGEADSSKDEEQAPWPGLPPQVDSENVVQTEEIYLNPTNKSPISLDDGEFLIIPTDTSARRAQYDAERPNEIVGDTEQEVRWVDTLQAGEFTRPRKGAFDKAVNRPFGKWRQSVRSEGAGDLSAARPRLATPGDAMLTGARAVQRVRGILGLGSMIQIPLWHSGFWLTLRAPLEGDLLDFHRRVADAKVSLGRKTYGLVFANSAAYIAQDLVNFAMDHLHDATVKSTVDIRKHIKIHDLQAIAWGMACVIWPKGFQYARSVLSGEGQEKQEFKGLLNLTKLLFVDTSQFTPWQVAHMSRRQGNTMTDEMLERYQSEFEVTERKIQLENGLSMTLKVPSIDEYFTAGDLWISSITNMVDRAFQQPPTDEARDRFISHYGKASVMRQFSHFVKDLQEDGDHPLIFNDAETINQLLETLSQVDSIRKVFFDAVHDFTDDTNRAVIATPTVNESEELKLPRFPHLMPIDSLYTFFTLLVQKSDRIAGRDL